MVTLDGNMTSVWSPFNRTIFFARQPEPDLEFTEEELDQTITTKARGPMNPQKKSGGGSPILWILAPGSCRRHCLCLDGTGNADRMAEPLPGGEHPTTNGHETEAVAPAPVAPPAPAPQAAPSPSNGASAPLTPATSPAAAVPPAAPAVVPLPQTAARPAAPVVPSLDPMFSEGQKVTVTVNDTAPGGNIPLYADSSSSKPGPTIRPGISLTIMDGDLQPGGWMYWVRTDDGATGWVSEKRLRLKF